MSFSCALWHMCQVTLIMCCLLCVCLACLETLCNCAARGSCGSRLQLLNTAALSLQVIGDSCAVFPNPPLPRSHHHAGVEWHSGWSPKSSGREYADYSRPRQKYIEFRNIDSAGIITVSLSPNKFSFMCAWPVHVVLLCPGLW